MLIFICLAAMMAQAAVPLGSATTAQTDHLTVSAAASRDAVALGDRVSLIFEIQPRRNMHVYAPGKHEYQVVAVTVDSQPWLRVHPTKYPPSEIYYFKPLDERVPVYQQLFRITKEITILATPEARKVLAGRKDVTVTARLEYQACDEKLCYRPQTVPLEWRLSLVPPEKPRRP